MELESLSPIYSIVRLVHVVISWFTCVRVASDEFLDVGFMLMNIHHTVVFWPLCGCCHTILMSLRAEERVWCQCMHDKIPDCPTLVTGVYEKGDIKTIAIVEQGLKPERCEKWLTVWSGVSNKYFSMCHTQIVWYLMLPVFVRGGWCYLWITQKGKWERLINCDLMKL